MSDLLDRRRRPILHVAFWLVYATFFFYQISFGRRGEVEWARVLPDFGFHIASLLALSYFNYFLLLPEALRTKDWRAYLLRFLPFIVVGSVLTLLGKRAIIASTMDNPGWAQSTRFAVSVLLSTAMIVLFVGLLRFVEDYFDNEARRTELENASLSSELRFLRAQVNPHFLFNTLNNLYYLAVNQSPQTPEVIAKLAGLMRYLLHDSNHATVPLDKEVEYMRNYISLEQLRLNDQVPIAFEVSGPTGSVQVVPLILITFLENAFKHGINNSGGASFIDVYLKASPAEVSFEVVNSKVVHSSKTVTESSGIGLANARRRLELGYPGRHSLAVTETDDVYRVSLSLKPATA